MTDWAKAGTIDELKSMFIAPPPIPSQKNNTINKVYLYEFFKKTKT